MLQQITRLFKKIQAFDRATRDKNSLWERKSYSFNKFDRDTNAGMRSYFKSKI